MWLGEKITRYSDNTKIKGSSLKQGTKYVLEAKMMKVLRHMAK